MTMFKLPDFESNGGNLLSKFIGVVRIRYSLLDRAGALLPIKSDLLPDTRVSMTRVLAREIVLFRPY